MIIRLFDADLPNGKLAFSSVFTPFILYSTVTAHRLLQLRPVSLVGIVSTRRRAIVPCREVTHPRITCSVSTTAHASQTHYRAVLAESSLLGIPVSFSLQSSKARHQVSQL
jgi:hypothetical protein